DAVRPTVVLASGGDHGPFVITGGAPAGGRAGVGAHVAHHQPTGPGMDAEAERVSKAEGPDLGAEAGIADERVVVGHRAVRVQPKDLAPQIHRVLRSAACVEPLPAGPAVDGRITVALEGI